MPHRRGRADRRLDLRIDRADLPCDSAAVSEAAFVVALVAVSITFLVTVLGAAWKLGSTLAAQAQELKDLRTRIEALDKAQAKLDLQAENQRTKADDRWNSMTDKLGTITGLLSAHRSPP